MSATLSLASSTRPAPLQSMVVEADPDPVMLTATVAFTEQEEGPYTPGPRVMPRAWRDTPVLVAAPTTSTAYLETGRVDGRHTHKHTRASTRVAERSQTPPPPTTTTTDSVKLRSVHHGVRSKAQP